MVLKKEQSDIYHAAMLSKITDMDFVIKNSSIKNGKYHIKIPKSRATNYQMMTIAECNTDIREVAKPEFQTDKVPDMRPFTLNLLNLSDAQLPTDDDWLMDDVAFELKLNKIQ